MSSLKLMLVGEDGYRAPRKLHDIWLSCLKMDVPVVEAAKAFRWEYRNCVDAKDKFLGEPSDVESGEAFFKSMFFHLISYEQKFAISDMMTQSLILQDPNLIINMEIKPLRIPGTLKAAEMEVGFLIDYRTLWTRFQERDDSESKLCLLQDECLKQDWLWERLQPTMPQFLEDVSFWESCGQSFSCSSFIARLPSIYKEILAHRISYPTRRLIQSRKKKTTKQPYPAFVTIATNPPTGQQKMKRSVREGLLLGSLLPLHCLQGEKLLYNGSDKNIWSLKLADKEITYTVNPDSRPYLFLDFVRQFALVDQSRKQWKELFHKDETKTRRNDTYFLGLLCFVVLLGDIDLLERVVDFLCFIDAKFSLKSALAKISNKPIDIPVISRIKLDQKESKYLDSAQILKIKLDPFFISERCVNRQMENWLAQFK